MFVIKSMFFPEACRPVSANKHQSFVKTIRGHTRDGSIMPVPRSHTCTNQACVYVIFSSFTRTTVLASIQAVFVTRKNAIDFRIQRNQHVFFDYKPHRKLMSLYSRPTAASVQMRLSLNSKSALQEHTVSSMNICYMQAKRNMIMSLQRLDNSTPGQRLVSPL